jgi:hypothetical protein
MATERCRRCSCVIGKQAHEQNGVVYCCRECAERYECECGCKAYEMYESG